MINIPKKVIERFIKQTGKFQRILKKASDSDINEADTVKIVVDILSDVFGFDKYHEITSEYAIKSTFCDLAVKVNDDVKFLIEVKSVTIDLKENHLKQAINYGAHEGIKWVILTNGRVWKGYIIELKDSINFDEVFEIDFLNINPRKHEDQQKLILIAKEGLSKDVIAEYQERTKCVNRFVVGAILLNKSSLEMIRRELRKLKPGLKVDINEIESILKNEVIKRNIIEGDDSKEANKLIRKCIAKAKRIHNKNGAV